jgi:hypothetical protein
MKWFRVEDAGEKRVVLVEAESVQDACQVYLRDFPPDLYSKEASADEIATWLRDPWPWSID